jgi:ectoine hydroxylase-related dioxygenase (phytanoyl-CoA dioxygenase family)
MSTSSIEDVIDRRPQVEFEVSLSQDQVDQFHELGFVSIQRITTDEEIAWLGEVYDWLFSEKRAAMGHAYFDLVRPHDADGEDRLPQIIAPERRFPQLLETAFLRNGRKLAAQILGVEAQALQCWGHMIRKPPKVGDALPWHQDEAYWPPEFDYEATGCWTTLDDATIESGCMSFIPGSHRRPILPHRHVNDDPKVQALFTEPDPADIARAVPQPVAAGGAVMHHPRALHASGPNVSTWVRRAYANEWQLPPVTRATPADRPWHYARKKAFAESEAT